MISKKILITSMGMGITCASKEFMDSAQNGIKKMQLQSTNGKNS